MTMHCPRCKSTHLDTKDYARKAGGAVGTAAGVAIGASAATVGGEVGLAIGTLAGPLGMIIGGGAGTIIGALVGGTMGCVTGVKLGEVVDNNVFNNYRCLKCGYTFRLTQTLPEPGDHFGWPADLDD